MMILSPEMIVSKTGTRFATTRSQLPLVDEDSNKTAKRRSQSAISLNVAGSTYTEIHIKRKFTQTIYRVQPEPHRSETEFPPQIMTSLLQNDRDGQQPCFHIEI